MRLSAIFLESGLSGSGAVGGALSRASAPTGRSTRCFLPSAVSGRGAEGCEGFWCEIPVPLMATSREAACASLSLSVVSLGPKLSESWRKSQLSSSVDSGVTRKRASARAFEGDSAASLVLAWNCCSKLTARPASAAASDIGPGSEREAAGDPFNCIKGREMDSKGRRSPLASVEKLSNFSKALSWLLFLLFSKSFGVCSIRQYLFWLRSSIPAWRSRQLKSGLTPKTTLGGLGGSLPEAEGVLGSLCSVMSRLLHLRKKPKHEFPAEPSVHPSRMGKAGRGSWGLGNGGFAATGASGISSFWRGELGKHLEAYGEKDRAIAGPMKRTRLDRDVNMLRLSKVVIERRPGRGGPEACRREAFISRNLDRQGGPLSHSL